MVSCCSFKSAFVIINGKFTLKEETKQNKLHHELKHKGLFKAEDSVAVGSCTVERSATETSVLPRDQGEC